MRTTFLVLLMIAMALAGCIGGGGSSGDFQLLIHDDAPTATEFVVQGAWVQQAGNGSWLRIAENGTNMSFSGNGSMQALAGALPAGEYDRIRLVFQSVEANGTSALLAESGFELPAPFSVTEGGATEMELEIGWPDALFESEDGLTFLPVVVRLRVVEDGAETLVLEAEEIQATFKQPVARMRVFEESGFVMFDSDFVGESPERPIKGTSGLLTLSAANSEALAPDASVVAWQWFLGDTLVSEQRTEPVQFPLAGGNFTLRLVVTDSNGESDAQTLKMALAPGTASLAWSFNGTVTGVDPVSSDGDMEQNFTVNATSFGSGVQMTLVHARMVATSNEVGVLTNVGLTLLDGAGEEVGSDTSGATAPSTERTVREEYAIGAATPADGEWLAQISPSLTLGTTYQLDLTVSFSGINPGVLAFLAQYDDGHTHCHPGIDDCG